MIRSGFGVFFSKIQVMEVTMKVKTTSRERQHGIGVQNSIF